MDNQDRPQMEAALKQTIIPALRSAGFRGSFPHFRRIGNIQTDLWTFQVDKYGGGFVIEISSCPREGMTTAWGKFIPASKVTAHDINERLRLQNHPGSDTTAWYRYDTDAIDTIIARILEALPLAEDWWAERSVHELENRKRA
ncbi:MULTISPECIES: DUF4304 domain-containing protein [unclassified Achromobacter]|uniref:DUF4304 domain-containing protein n=1 Tax=unclassified Achromobacter TaxID=2626865 RepID=UPI000B515507|nr:MULTISPECIES: DUF4304 domain-containing protein [unclassified Achromobacter]OWT71476.1 hypothetical protein CEY05_25135 [Achromobacter sp. HZ34]OWT73133.1 hypothetical protein CEY04_23970 [Achromobacter sp. HZ28]